MTERQYGQLVQEMSPKSPMGMDCLRAFLAGGLICTIGQLFLNLYTGLGLEKQEAGTLASMMLAVELFGGEYILFFGAAAAVSYALSGHISLYHAQIIVEPKLGHREK